LLEFAAFLKLRQSRPDIHRPYSVPLGIRGSGLMLLPASAFILGLMAMASPLTWAICGAFTAVGLGLYPLLQRAKERGWCEFHTDWDKFG
ncbi:unnamed protein product, partial [Discosporangium mesarthrocarpum]